MKSIQLSIPNPCNENWNDMLPSNSGRFCTSCEKVVIDLSTKTHNELVHFFEGNTRSICAKMPSTALNHPIFTSEPGHKNAVSLIAILLGAALITSINSWSAQNVTTTSNVSLIALLNEDPLLNTHVSPTDSNVRIIEFLIIDDLTGEPMPFAAVFLRDAAENTIKAMKSDYDGKAKFTLTEEQYALIHSVRVNSLDFDEQILIWKEIHTERTISVRKNEIVVRVSEELMGDIIIVGSVSLNQHKKDIRKGKRSVKKQARSRK